MPLDLPTSPLRLDQRVSLVTGGSTGIGLAIGAALAQSGADVILAARSVEELKEAKAQVSALSTGRVEIISVDVAQRDQVTRMAEQISQRFGRLDILINNAGVNIPARVDGDSVGPWDTVQAVNLGGTFNVTRECLPLLRRAQWGRIVNIASTLALRGGDAQGAFVAAKAGVVGFTRACALENARFGITVNVICPGWVTTRATQAAAEDPQRSDEIVRSIPIGRWGRPEDVALGVLYLASEGAGFVTGTTLVIDGGRSAQ